MSDGAADLTCCNSLRVEDHLTPIMKTSPPTITALFPGEQSSRRIPIGTSKGYPFAYADELARSSLLGLRSPSLLRQSSQSRRSPQTRSVRREWHCSQRPPKVNDIPGRLTTRSGQLPHPPLRLRGQPPAIDLVVGEGHQLPAQHCTQPRVEPLHRIARCRAVLTRRHIPPAVDRRSHAVEYLTPGRRLEQLQHFVLALPQQIGSSLLSLRLGTRSELTPSTHGQQSVCSGGGACSRSAHSLQIRPLSSYLAIGG